MVLWSSLGAYAIELHGVVIPSAARNLSSVFSLRQLHSRVFPHIPKWLAGVSLSEGGEDAAHIGEAGDDARHWIVGMNFVFEIDEALVADCG